MKRIIKAYEDATLEKWSWHMALTQKIVQDVRVVPNLAAHGEGLQRVTNIAIVLQV